MLCRAVRCDHREVEATPADDYPESDEDAVQQQQQLREARFGHSSSSSLSLTASFSSGAPGGGGGGGSSSVFSSSGTRDPLGDLTWPLESSKTVYRGASSQLLSIGQGVGSSAAAAAAAAGAGISSLLANRGKSTERQRAATSVRGCCKGAVLRVREARAL